MNIINIINIDLFFWLDKVFMKLDRYKCNGNVDWGSFENGEMLTGAAL